MSQSNDKNISLLSVKGIGEKTAVLFEKLGISTVLELLLFFPRTYIKYPEATDRILSLFDMSANEPVAIRARITERPFVKRTRRMDITTANARCTDGNIGLVWFRMPYIANKLYMDNEYIFFGKLSFSSGAEPKMEQARIFTPDEYERLKRGLFPIYHLTKGLKNGQVLKAVSNVLSNNDIIDEYIPDEILKKNGLVSYAKAINDMHFPKDEDAVSDAKRRLAYNEFFDFMILCADSAKSSINEPNPWKYEKHNLFDKARLQLPFELTAGQEAALNDLVSDMHDANMTQRLIQGDVGSGKTIIAFLIMLLAVENGYKSAIMVPTEVLARQHFESFTTQLTDLGVDIPVYLLTGSTKTAEKKRIYEAIKSDEPAFIIGTHALITEKTEYNNLSVVITDEQHRFGVKQRLMLSQKGTSPYMVVMSATPIPRTLAMILYQDMNISLIKELPKNRKPIKNALMTPAERTKAYQFIAKEIANGHQAYIICPLVEAGEKTDAENVTEYAEKLKDTMGSAYRIGLLHGRMKPKEKDAVMNEFYEHSIDILVSTTVVEVGVNVPNATVMLIENADRFGLAALHQLRGRVGRGADQSYCIFMDGSEGKAKKRLEILANTNDGFEIANEDLKLRGPGDFYGIRQSGDLEFKIADLFAHADLLAMASADVKALLEADPELKSDENIRLKEHLNSSLKMSYDNL